MEIVTKEYYIFEQYKNCSIEEIEKEMKNIKSIGYEFISNYEIRKYSVLKQMKERFKNNNYKNPFKKPNKHDDIIY